MPKPFYDISNIVGSSYFIADKNRLAEYSIDSFIPKAAVFPDSEDQIAEILKICSAENISISPMGGNTKSYYGNIPKRLDLIISTKRLNTFIQHDIDDFIATAQSGISLENFQKSILKSNQYLALDPPLLDRGCTLGGLISTNGYGPSRHRFNGIKENLLSLRIVRADGKKVKGGG